MLGLGEYRVKGVGSDEGWQSAVLDAENSLGQGMESWDPGLCISDFASYREGWVLSHLQKTKSPKPLNQNP